MAYGSVNISGVSGTDLKQVRLLADTAKTTADAAQNTASAAKTAADNAKTAADQARQTAEAARTAANEAKSAADNVSGSVGAPFFMTFSKSDWTVKNNVAAIVINRAAHHLNSLNSCVNARFFSCINSVYKSNTWHALESYVIVDSDTITLACAEGSGYDGAVLISG